MHEVTFEKIVPDGSALAHIEGKALFVLGALPGERAMVRLVQNKRSWARGDIVELVEASPHRGQPHEQHYMSCSPWQAVDYAYQLELKRAMLAEQFARPELALAVADMVGAAKPLGYRNKLEFTVETDPYGELELAFHERGSFNKLVPAPEGCVLGSAAMNKIAKRLMEGVRELDLADFADTLTIRESQTGGDLVAVLALRYPTKRDWSRLMVQGLAGVAVTHKRGHLATDVIWSHGRLELGEDVGGVTMTYPWDSFFQVNVPMFSQTLEAIARYASGARRVVDLYGGAGTIGLVLAKQGASVTGIEVLVSSVELANHNAARAGLATYEAVAVASEKMDPEVLAGAEVVVVDPPRAGLHVRVIEQLLSAAPAKIIYLSCNPATQVRDLMLLQAGGYNVGQPTGYDFYPGTLHLESLVVLTRG